MQVRSLPLGAHDIHLYMSQSPEKKYRLPCAPIEDSDEPAHFRSLIIVFNERSMDSHCPNNASFGKLKR